MKKEVYEKFKKLQSIKIKPDFIKETDSSKLESAIDYILKSYKEYKESHKAKGDELFDEFLGLLEENNVTKRSNNNVSIKLIQDYFKEDGAKLSDFTAIWEVIRRYIFQVKLSDKNKDEIDTKISECCVELIKDMTEHYNKNKKKANLKNEPKSHIKLIIPEIGSKYDSKTQAIKSYKSSGNVEYVLLPGYYMVEDSSDNESIKSDTNIHKAIIDV